MKKGDPSVNVNGGNYTTIWPHLNRWWVSVCVSVYVSVGASECACVCLFVCGLMFIWALGSGSSWSAHKDIHQRYEMYSTTVINNINTFFTTLVHTLFYIRKCFIRDRKFWFIYLIKIDLKESFCKLNLLFA